MDKIGHLPIIAAACDPFPFGFTDPSESFDSSSLFGPESPDQSFNENNEDGTNEAQTSCAGAESTQMSHSFADATPLPIRGMPSFSITATSPPKPQRDENRRIAPLPFRNATSTYPTGLESQKGQNPQVTGHILRAPLESTNNGGTKRKSGPSNETSPLSEPKKRKTRAISERKRQKEKASEVDNHDQISSVPLRHDSGNNIQYSARGVGQGVITNLVQPGPFSNHLLPAQVTANESRAISARGVGQGVITNLVQPGPFSNHLLPAQVTANPNESRAIRCPPTWNVNNPQELSQLVLTHGLPGIVQVDINKHYPTRILQMMVAITDPQSQHFLAAYFVPYLWFPADPKRPYRIQKNDRYYWGERIDEYRKRVKCGRIAITVAGLPVLFFTSEEKKKVDSINYKIMFDLHCGTVGNSQDLATQSLPADQVPGATSLVAVSGSQYQAPNVQNNGPGTVVEDTTSHQIEQSLLPSTSVINSSTTDLQLYGNNGIDINTSTYGYDIPAIVQAGPSTESFSNLTPDLFPGVQFNSGAFDTNADILSNFAVNNINDLSTTTETLLSTEVLHSFSESQILHHAPFSAANVQQQVNDDTNKETLPDITAFWQLFDFGHNPDGATTIGSTLDPGPSNGIVTQSYSEMEDMYMNFDWCNLQDGQSSK